MDNVTTVSDSGGGPTDANLTLSRSTTGYAPNSTDGGSTTRALETVASFWNTTLSPLLNGTTTTSDQSDEVPGRRPAIGLTTSGVQYHVILSLILGCGVIIAAISVFAACLLFYKYSNHQRMRLRSQQRSFMPYGTTHASSGRGDTAVSGNHVYSIHCDSASDSFSHPPEYTCHDPSSNDVHRDNDADKCTTSGGGGGGGGGESFGMS